MNMLKNKDLRQQLEELKSELNKLSVETEALEAEEMEEMSKNANAAEEKEQSIADSRTGAPDTSGQYFKKFQTQLLEKDNDHVYKNSELRKKKYGKYRTDCFHCIVMEEILKFFL